MKGTSIYLKTAKEQSPYAYANTKFTLAVGSAF